MSVLEYPNGALFVARVIKHLATNPDNRWVNSYEFRATVAGSTDELLNLVGSLLGFEQKIHFSTVRFDQVIISTWEPDSKPYDPAAFLSIPTNVAGQLAGGLDQLSLNNVMKVARVPISGRFGHLFYRGCLGEADVASSAGSMELVTISAKQDLIDSSLETSNLAAYIGNAPEGIAGMVLVGKTSADVRAVQGLIVTGATSLPTDHAWFNRTKPPVTP